MDDGYVVYYLAETESTNQDKIPLVVQSRVITMELKDKFLSFLKTIDNRTPRREEFLDWYVTT